LKRPSPKGNKPPEAIALDIKRDIPQKQLAAIGALALAYNEVEATIDKLFFASTGLPEHLQIEVSTRIQGIDGTLEIIKAATKEILSEKEQSQLANALGESGFKQMKNYRDCVIHARHLNFSTSIGIKVDRKARIFEVLVRQDALDAAFNILIALKDELFMVFLAIMVLTESRKRAPDDPSKSRLEALAANFRSQFQGLQRARLSLPPIPEFPVESELRELESLFQQAQLEALVAHSDKVGGQQPRPRPTFLARRGGGPEKPKRK